jgi:thioredoxin 1
MAKTMRNALLGRARTMFRRRDSGSLPNEMATLGGSAIELNAANFQREVLGAAEPVLVAFWTEWSDACKAMVQVLESVVEDPSVPCKVGLVNAEENEELAEQYGVRTVPALLIFNQNSLRDRIVGRTTEPQVREKLERLT